MLGQLLAAAGLLLLPLVPAAAPRHEELAALGAPKLAELVRRVAEGEGSAVAAELAADPHAEICPHHRLPPGHVGRNGSAAALLPIVTHSGMGDSCFNSGVQSLTRTAGEHLGVYARCVPTGDNVIADTLSSFLMTMDRNVDEFAMRVRADPELAGGFNAFGLSQGSNVIRGYIQRYNDPPVVTFMALSSPIVGVGAFPMCPPDVPLLGPICQLLAETLGELAYLPIIQDILFQANYFRDPTKLDTEPYRRNSQLGRWNNEGDSYNETYKTNFEQVRQVIAVMALQDAVVWPVIAQQWGQPKPGQWSEVNNMTESDWYQDNSFGLRTLDEAGRLYFEAFSGAHLGFTTAQLLRWLDIYFTTVTQ